MTIAPPPERLTTSASELAGMLSSAGLTPTPNSPLPAADPSAKTSPTENQRILLAVAADPVGALRIVGPGGDRGVGITTSLLWNDPRGPFVIATAIDDGFDLTMLTNRSMALSWLDRALSLTTLPSPAATDRLDLDLASYAALLALADAVTEVRLREQLDRRQGRVAGLTLGDLRRAFDTGIGAVDDRWAVSGTRLVCPVDLSTVAEELEHGIDRLIALGLAAGDSASLGLTQTGAPFVSALASQPRSTGIGLAVATDSGIDVTHLTVHRSAIAIHVGVWKQLGDQPLVSLSQPSASRLLGLFDGLITRR